MLWQVRAGCRGSATAWRCEVGGVDTCSHVQYCSREPPLSAPCRCRHRDPYLHHRRDWLPTDHQGFFLDLGELPSSANPDEFGFRGIEFQPIWAHPGFDFRYAGQQTCGSGLTIRGGATDVDLGVIGIYVDSNSTSHGNSDDITMHLYRKYRGAPSYTLFKPYGLHLGLEPALKLYEPGLGLFFFKFWCPVFLCKFFNYWLIIILLRDLLRLLFNPPGIGILLKWIARCILGIFQRKLYNPSSTVITRTMDKLKNFTWTEKIQPLARDLLILKALNFAETSNL